MFGAAGRAPRLSRMQWLDQLAEGGDIELREVKLHVGNLSVDLDVVIRSGLSPLIAPRELPASPSPRSGGRPRSAR